MKTSIRSNTKELQKALKLLGANAFPQATAEVLNFQAKGSARQAKENVRKRMVVRTQFTIKSTKQDRRAKGNNVDAMFSRVVNNSPYLYKQDEGGNDVKRSVPTIFTRKNSFKNKVMRNLRIDKLGRFGKWKGKGPPIVTGKHRDRKSTRLNSSH